MNKLDYLNAAYYSREAYPEKMEGNIFPKSVELLECPGD